MQKVMSSNTDVAVQSGKRQILFPCKGFVTHGGNQELEACRRDGPEHEGQAKGLANARVPQLLGKAQRQMLCKV